MRNGYREILSLKLSGETIGRRLSQAWTSACNPIGFEQLRLAADREGFFSYGYRGFPRILFPAGEGIRREEHDAVSVCPRKPRQSVAAFEFGHEGGIFLNRIFRIWCAETDNPVNPVIPVKKSCQKNLHGADEYSGCHPKTFGVSLFYCVREISFGRLWRAPWLGGCGAAFAVRVSVSGRVCFVTCQPQWRQHDHHT